MPDAQRRLQQLRAALKDVVITPLPYSLSAVSAVALPMIVHGRVWPWLRPMLLAVPLWGWVVLAILIVSPHFMAMIPFWFRCLRKASEEKELLIQSQIRIRQLRDKLQ